jgi:hypothetical protein
MSVEHRWNDTDRNLSQCKFLGAFAKLRKTIISVVMSVRLSGRSLGTTLLSLDEFS